MEQFDDAYIYDLLSQKRNAKPAPPPAQFPTEEEEASDLELSDEDLESGAEQDDLDEKETAVSADHGPEESPRAPPHAGRRSTAKKSPLPVSSAPIPDAPPKGQKDKAPAPLTTAPIADGLTSPKGVKETPKKEPKKKRQKEKPSVTSVQVSANYQEPSAIAVRQSPAMMPVSPKRSPKTGGPGPRPLDLPSPAAAAPPPAPFANIVKQQQQKQQAEQAAALAKLQAQREQEAALVRQQQLEAEMAAAARKQQEEAETAAAQESERQRLQQQQQEAAKSATTAPPPGMRSSSPLTVMPPPGLGGPPSKTVLANKMRQKQQQSVATSEEPAADPSLLRPARLAAVQGSSARDSSPAVRAPPPQTFDAPLSDEQARNLEVMEASLRHMPTQADSDRTKHYLPRNPYHTPTSWPSAPSPVFEDPSFFEKYDTDTLFFIFYFQQGTYQQYLAASQLKKQSWRYHSKYLTWFQRHKDPQVTTDEFEQGTYVYFDYDHSWCQRIKSDFTFEYRYLEDDL